MTKKNLSSRLAFLRSSALGAIGLAFSSLAIAEKVEDSQPNIILIIGDDISADDFGFYGHPHIRTPGIGWYRKTFNLSPRKK